MTTEEKVEILLVTTTHSETGKHFTERFMLEDIEELEAVGLINVTRPTHGPTGIPCAAHDWSVEVTQTGQDFVERFPGYCIP